MSKRPCSSSLLGCLTKRLTGPHPYWLEHKIFDRGQPNCYPDSVALELTTPQSARHEDDPTDIFIHPSSYFSFDVCDHTLSVSLVPPLSPANSDLRFPTRTAFLDSMIATILDPPIGFRHGKLTQQLEGFISYIRLYTLRAYPRVLPNGDLEPEHAAVLASLRPENRHWFESKVRKTYKDWATQVQARRAILESIGRTSGAQRPFPRDRFDIWSRQVRGFHTFAPIETAAPNLRVPLSLTRPCTPTIASAGRSLSQLQDLSGGDDVAIFLARVKSTVGAVGDTFWPLFGHDDECRQYEHDDGFSFYYLRDEFYVTRGDVIVAHMKEMTGQQAAAILPPVACTQDTRFRSSA
ncbi:hypothetical protein EW146_g9431 [Bondarzewia mesenterica]|uniref:Uncharacterized protein n=1 Tax=Bondarzewia mesenterica TaxID=1095465 RepID=A0A4S4L7X0_9AGAM|nr:hypothetical protein EW146_g9431 [Bondarzewia mesenterica]